MCKDQIRCEIAQLKAEIRIETDKVMLGRWKEELKEARKRLKEV